MKSGRQNFSHHPEMKKLEKLASILDDAFVVPGLGWRFGIDGIIGLIPGFGDLAGMFMSFYFMYCGARMKVSKVVLTRMAANILIETVVGAIPIIGDLFDFAWKANRRNLRLIERSLQDPSGTKTRSIGLLIVLVSGIVLVAVSLVWMVISLIQWIITI